MSEHLRKLQRDLAAAGFDPGAADGKNGPRTRAALDRAAEAGRLAVVAAPVAVKAAPADLPWMIEARRILGRHEVRDNGWLRNWLRSDGKTLGDPAKLPWCGDFVETCIRLALPSEPFPGALGENPYWARNWMFLGDQISPTYGAALVFGRQGGGHVGFAVGEDASAFHVLGGNQSNAVTIARIDKSRLLGARWPATFARPAKIDLPRMGAAGKLSTNEA